MAQITLTIPDDKAIRFRDGLCGAGGYQENIDIGTVDNPNIVPNPQSKAAFAKQRIAYLAISDVKQYEQKVATQAAKEAQDQIDEIDIS